VIMFHENYTVDGNGAGWMTPTEHYGTAWFVYTGVICYVEKLTATTSSGTLLTMVAPQDTTMRDSEVFSRQTSATNVLNWNHIHCHRVSASDFYMFQSSSVGTIGKIAIWKIISGVHTSLGSLVSSVTAFPFLFKSQTIGTTIRCKIWTGTEPAWGGANTLSVTDSSITAEGGSGIGGWGTNTVVAGLVNYDDLYIDNFVPAERPKPQSLAALLTQ